MRLWLKTLLKTNCIYLRIITSWWVRVIDHYHSICVNSNGQCVFFSLRLQYEYQALDIFRPSRESNSDPLGRVQNLNITIVNIAKQVDGATTSSHFENNVQIYMISYCKTNWLIFVVIYRDSKRRTYKQTHIQTKLSQKQNLS